MPDPISIDQDGMFSRIVIYDRAIVAAFKIRVRFNRHIAVIGPDGLQQTTIDVVEKTGSLAQLWRLTEVTDVVKLEMDAESFRILLTDGSVISSPNVLDVRRPDLAQVEFWTPATGHEDDEPSPSQVRRYPAILAGG